MVLFENVQAFNSRSETLSVFAHNPLRNKLFAPIALEAARCVRPENATPEVLQAMIASLRGDWR